LTPSHWHRGSLKNTPPISSSGLTLSRLKPHRPCFRLRIMLMLSVFY
jgi:hypothetical protein